MNSTQPTLGGFSDQYFGEDQTLGLVITNSDGTYTITGSGAPTISAPSNSGDPHWYSIFNTASSVFSQWLASRGRYPTAQLGSGSVFALNGQPAAYQYAGQMYATNPSQNVGSGLGSGVGSGIDAAINWAATNPLIVFGGAIGLYLLFKEPPRRR